MQPVDLNEMRLFGDVPELEGTDPDSLEGRMIQEIQLLRNLHGQYAAALATKQQSGEVTDKGLKRHAQRLGEPLLTRIKKADADLTNYYRPDLERLRHSLFDKQPGESDLPGAIRAWEIRQELKSRQPTEVVSAFEQAVENVDRDLFLAVVDAPAIYDNFGLPPELVADGRRRWAERTDPMLAARVDRSEELAEQLSGAIAAVTSVIEDHTGEPPETPLTKMASETGGRSLAAG